MNINSVSGSQNFGIKLPDNALKQIRHGLPNMSLQDVQKILSHLQETGSDATRLIKINLGQKKCSDGTNIGFVKMLMKTGKPRQERMVAQRRVITDKTKSIGADSFNASIDDCVQKAEEHYITECLYRNSKKKTFGSSSENKNGLVKSLELFYPKLKKFIDSTYRKNLK